MNHDPRLAAGALEYYRPVERWNQFIHHWVDTYDPRNAASGLPSYMPFLLFERQAQLGQFLNGCLNAETNGLIEKCRDMGATWYCAAWSVCAWLFLPGAAVGWGSRKEQLVDKIGDPDSIFEKIRIVIGRLPRLFLPATLNARDHLTYMRCVNPVSGATITGEAGDNIGRGGRKLIYFKDESAHYERPEKIEAALSDNTRVQIDISSVNGTGNVFYRKRDNGQVWEPGVTPDAGRTRIFVMEWRHHPAKTQAWYDRRRQAAEREGLLHVFAQEVDRDYSGAVEGTIIPSAWVDAAVDAHLKLNIAVSGQRFGGLDVADEGADSNALALRQSILLDYIAEWGARDTAATARHALSSCMPFGKVILQYDCIGVGAGVKGEANNLKELNKTKNVTWVPWNAGAGVLWPKKHVVEDDRDSPVNEDHYKNLKAQAWWELRRRFYRTWRAVTEGAQYPADSLISLSSTLPLLAQAKRELSQATSRPDTAMRLVVDKKPNGTRSPNVADAIVMAYWPIPLNSGQPIFGAQGYG